MNYCETIFKEYKDEVKYWIVFNEINMMTSYFGDIYTGGILSNGTTHLDIAHASEEALSADKMKKRFKALHHQFVACAKVVEIGHKINEQFKIGSMVAADAHYPYSCNPVNVIAAQKSMRRIWYCADVMVRGEYSYVADSYLKDQGICLTDLILRWKIKLFYKPERLIFWHLAIILPAVMQLMRFMNCLLYTSPSPRDS